MFIHSLSSPPLLLSISYPPLRIALCMFTCILNILTHNFKHKTFARRQLSTSFSSVCIYSPHLHVALSATLKHKAYLLFIKDPPGDLFIYNFSRHKSLYHTNYNYCFFHPLVILVLSHHPIMELYA